MACSAQILGLDLWWKSHQYLCHGHPSYKFLTGIIQSQCFSKPSVCVDKKNFVSSEAPLQILQYQLWQASSKCIVIWRDSMCQKYEIRHSSRINMKTKFPGILAKRFFSFSSINLFANVVHLIYLMWMVTPLLLKRRLRRFYSTYHVLDQFLSQRLDLTLAWIFSCYSRAFISSIYSSLNHDSITECSSQECPEKNICYVHETRLFHHFHASQFKAQFY